MAADKKPRQTVITLNYSNAAAGKLNKHGLPVGLTVAKLRQAQKTVIHNAIIQGTASKQDIQKIERAYSSLFKQIDRAAADRAFIRDMRAAKGPKAIDTSKVSQDKYTRAIANRFKSQQQLARLGFKGISTYAKPLRDATGRITNKKTNPNTNQLYLHIAKVPQVKIRDTFKGRPGDIQAVKYAAKKGYIPKVLATNRIKTLELKLPKRKGPIIIDSAYNLGIDEDEPRSGPHEPGEFSDTNDEFDEAIKRMGGIMKALQYYPEAVARLAEEYGIDLNKYYNTDIF